MLNTLLNLDVLLQDEFSVSELFGIPPDERDQVVKSLNTKMLEMNPCTPGELIPELVKIIDSSDLLSDAQKSVFLTTIIAHLDND